MVGLVSCAGRGLWSALQRWASRRPLPWRLLWAPARPGRRRSRRGSAAGWSPGRPAAPGRLAFLRYAPAASSGVPAARPRPPQPRPPGVRCWPRSGCPRSSAGLAVLTSGHSSEGHMASQAGYPSGTGAPRASTWPPCCGSPASPAGSPARRDQRPDLQLCPGGRALRAVASARRYRAQPRRQCGRAVAEPAAVPVHLLRHPEGGPGHGAAEPAAESVRDRLPVAGLRVRAADHLRGFCRGGGRGRPAGRERAHVRGEPARPRRPARGHQALRRLRHFADDTGEIEPTEAYGTAAIIYTSGTTGPPKGAELALPISSCT